MPGVVLVGSGGATVGVYVSAVHRHGALVVDEVRYTPAVTGDGIAPTDRLRYYVVLECKVYVAGDVLRWGLSVPISTVLRMPSPRSVSYNTSCICEFGSSIGGANQIGGRMIELKL